MMATVNTKSLPIDWPTCPMCETGVNVVPRLDGTGHVIVPEMWHCLKCGWFPARPNVRNKVKYEWWVEVRHTSGCLDQMGPYGFWGALWLFLKAKRGIHVMQHVSLIQKNTRTS